MQSSLTIYLKWGKSSKHDALIVTASNPEISTGNIIISATVPDQPHNANAKYNKKPNELQGSRKVDNSAKYWWKGSVGMDLRFYRQMC